MNLLYIAHIGEGNIGRSGIGTLHGDLHGRHFDGLPILAAAYRIGIHRADFAVRFVAVAFKERHHIGIGNGPGVGIDERRRLAIVRVFGIEPAQELLSRRCTRLARRDRGKPQSKKRREYESRFAHCVPPISPGRHIAYRTPGARRPFAEAADWPYAMVSAQNHHPESRYGRRRPATAAKAKQRRLWGRARPDRERLSLDGYLHRYHSGGALWPEALAIIPVRH